MKLYYADASPFARKTRVALIETGQIDSVEIISGGANPQTDLGPPAAANPLKKLPCMVLDSGQPLYDSRVICRYIDSLNRQTGLYPDAPKLWQTLTLEATADGIMDAVLLMVYEARMRPEESRSEVWVEAQWSKARNALDALERNWMPYLEGPPDMAHFAIACALGYIDFRQSARNWRDGRQKLAAWEAAFVERPSLQATIPKD